MVHAAVLAVSVYCHCLPVRWIEAIHWRIRNERKQHANRERDLLMSRAGRRSTADDTTLIAMALHASATKLLLIWEWRVKQLFLLCWENGSGRRVSKWEWASKCVRQGKCVSSAVARTGQRVRSAGAKRRLPKQNCKRSNKAKRILQHSTQGYHISYFLARSRYFKPAKVTFLLSKILATLILRCGIDMRLRFLFVINSLCTCSCVIAVLALFLYLQN